MYRVAAVILLVIGTDGSSKETGNIESALPPGILNLLYSCLQRRYYISIIRVLYPETIRINSLLGLFTTLSVLESESKAQQSDEDEEARVRIAYNSRYVLELQPTRGLHEADRMPQFPIVSDTTDVQFSLKACTTGKAKRARIACSLLGAVENRLPTGRVRREADCMPHISTRLSADMEIAIPFGNTDACEAVWGIAGSSLHIFKR